MHMRAWWQARGDVAVGLVTGNLEPIAWGKMQALGLLEAFSEPHFGGFGSDFCSGATGFRPPSSQPCSTATCATDVAAVQSSISGPAGKAVRHAFCGIGSPCCLLLML